MKKEVTLYGYSTLYGIEVSRVVTSGNGWALVYHRNPYGSHNLSLINSHFDELTMNGNAKCMRVARDEMPKHAYRKALRFLAEHDKDIDRLIADMKYIDEWEKIED